MKRIICKMKSLFLSLSILLYSTLSYANLPTASSASGIKAKSNTLLSDFFDMFTKGYNIAGAIAASLVFLGCVKVWTSEFNAIQEKGQGWWRLLAFFIVGIILIIAVFWGVSEGAAHLLAASPTK